MFARSLALLSIAMGTFLAGDRFLARMPAKVLRAGAFAIDITPERFPVIANGMFTERLATGAHDRLHARCLVLDDGMTRVAIVIVDNCMMPRDLLDEVKELAKQPSGIAPENMLISATHTHSAPSAMGCLGSDVDSRYPEFLKTQLARGIAKAAENLQPARAGWTVVRAPKYTHNRRWILRPDRVRPDPFGQKTVRAQMHPGYQNPDFIGPSGPVDPDLSMLAIQSTDGQPIAVLANYSMHYFGSPLLSADYFGAFAEKLNRLIGAKPNPSFVAMMSQGTSGDLMWMDYGQPQSSLTMDAYAETLAKLAHHAYRGIKYQDTVTLAMREKRLTLNRRLPDPQRLAWAKKIVGELKGRKPQTQEEIYAREQVFLQEEPRRELKLQALRIGDLGIAAIPDEVFAITGLKIKAFSPLQPTFTIELANGSEGYIPPPEQHKLGGYTTWPARTAGLEVQAEPKIVESVLQLLEQVSGKTRRSLADHHGPYARKVLVSKPSAYWRMSELSGTQAVDATGNHHGTYEDGCALFLDGPASAGFGGKNEINRAAHLAGGRLKADCKDLGSQYSVEMWFWNGLPTDIRPVTGMLLTREIADERSPAADRLIIGGTMSSPGKLLFVQGNVVLAGKSNIKLKEWNHVVLVRDGKEVRVYHNGNRSPEISGQTISPCSLPGLSIGGSNEAAGRFEGKIDEVSVYERPLSVEEIADHYRAAGRASK